MKLERGLASLGATSLRSTIYAWLRTRWIHEVGVPPAVRALAYAALSVILLLIGSILASPLWRQFGALVPSMTYRIYAASVYVPAGALRFAPIFLGIGLAFALSAAAMAGKRVRVLVSVLLLTITVPWIATVIGVEMAGTRELAARLSAATPSSGRLLLEELDRLVWPIGSTLGLLAVLWTPLRWKQARWGYLFLACLLLAQVLVAKLRVPVDLTAGMLGRGSDSRAIFLVEVLLLPLDQFLLTPYFLLAGAMIYTLALGLVGRLKQPLNITAGRAGHGPVIMRVFVAGVLLVKLARDGLLFVQGGPFPFTAVGAAGALVVASLWWIGRRVVKLPGAIKLAAFIWIWFFAVSIAAILLPASVPAFWIVSIGAALAAASWWRLRLDSSAALAALGLAFWQLYLAITDSAGGLLRPGRTRFEDLDAALNLVLLGLLTIAWRRGKLTTRLALYLLEMAIISSLIRQSSLLLEPGGGAFKGSLIVVCAAILWDILSNAREWTAGDSDWLPRASRVMLYFGFFLVQLTSTAWVQLENSPEAITRQTLFERAFTAFGAPLMCMVLGLRSRELRTAQSLVEATMPRPQTWTVLIYMAGDNDLEGEGGADLQELQHIGSSEHVTILVEFDRLDKGGTKRYRVDRGGLHTFDWNLEDANLNFGSADTLSDFIRWGLQIAPANRIMLVIWNHGGGWEDVPADFDWNSVGFVPSKGTGLSCSLFRETLEQLGDLSPQDRAIALDRHSQDFLDNQELQQALQKAGRKLDVVGFDACLMNMAEVAYQLRDVAAVVVGSQENEPGTGWPYDMVLKTLTSDPGIEPAKLGAAIVDCYGIAHTGEERITQSALDMVRTHDLATALDHLAAALIDALPTHRAQISEARETAQCFANAGYLDLQDLCSLLQRDMPVPVQAAASAVLAALGTPEAPGLVLANTRAGSSCAYAHGLSIYFPPGGKIAPRYDELDFARDTRWGAFLKAYAEASAARRSRPPL